MKPRNCTPTLDRHDTRTPPIRARDIVAIREAQEESSIARCPLCRGALVARQGRCGPYFFCACRAQAAQ